MVATVNTRKRSPRSPRCFRPEWRLRLLGRAIQAHGGGVSEDFPLAYLRTSSCALRLANTPDEVHEVVVTKLKLKKERKGGLVTEERKSEERGTATAVKTAAPPTNVR